MNEQHSERVEVVILDAATVFEAGETVYRYDLPGTGIVDGWAIAGAREQIQTLAGQSWPDVDVTVTADPSGTAVADEAVVILRRQLKAAGVHVTSESHPPTDEFMPPEKDLAEDYVPQAIPEPEPQVVNQGVRALDASVRPRARHAKVRQRRMPAVELEPFHAVIALVVVAVAGLALWTVGRDSNPQPVAADTAAVVSSPPPSAESTRPQPPAVTTRAVPTSRAPEPQELEAGGMSVELPEGFSAAEESGLVTATGRDPQLRVLLAADPLYSVPAQALFAEIRSQVDEDATLSNVEEEDDRLTYLERPGDESQVSWTTWVDKGHQMSVGCHTRAQPTTAHKAACRMAVESLEKN